MSNYEHYNPAYEAPDAPDLSKRIEPTTTASTAGAPRTEGKTRLTYHPDDLDAPVSPIAPKEVISAADIVIEDVSEGSLSPDELEALHDNRRELFKRMNEGVSTLEGFTLDLGHGRRYLLERVLGIGGFGATFIAINHDGERVVVKLTAPFDRRDMFFNETEPTPDESVQASIIRANFNEASALKKLSKLEEYNPGPNWIAGQHIPDPNEPNRRIVATVMEQIRGVDFKKFISERPDPKQVVQVFIQIAERLRTVHRSHIVHCDIKPANIMIDRSGDKPTTKLIDFGASVDGDRIAAQYFDAENNIKYDPKRRPVEEPKLAQPPVYAVMPKLVASPDFRIPTEPTTVRVDQYALGRLVQYYLYGDHYRNARLMEERRNQLSAPLKELDAIAIGLVNTDPVKRTRLEPALRQLTELFNKYDELAATAKQLGV